MLRDGGSAVDAMVAVNAALSVVYPHMTGVGGDAFWLIYEASTGRVHALNATGRAARSATLHLYRRFGATVPRRGPHAALTVPGAVDGWLQAHGRFGRLSFERVVAPAIRHARHGFPISRRLANAFGRWETLLKTIPDTAAALLGPDGAPTAREPLVQPALAQTLEAIAAGGRAEFYEGRVAAAMAHALRQQGGVLSEVDFAEHRSEWVEPLRGAYRGRSICTTPPNSQGYVHLLLLRLLERFDVAALRDRPADYIDLVVRAAAASFRVRDARLADPTLAAGSVADLFGADALEPLLADVTRDDVRAVFAPAAAPGDTTYSVAVDRDGNAAGVIQSLFHEWGSGVVAGSTGVLLQNRGSAFSLDPGRADRLAPGERPFHTLVASMQFDRDGALELIYGTMGGLGQPQTQTILVTRIVDHTMPVYHAIAAPRWVYGPLRGEPNNRRVRIERRFGATVMNKLRDRGHDCELIDRYSDDCGHAQAIQIGPRSLAAAADPRADGAALGL
jgi:gamma-glutamyltranspeptidase/glutathione hydrolase